MLISTGILAGAATFAVYFGATMLAIDKKLKYYNIIIDTTNKEIRIKCNAEKISLENFRVYTRLEHGEIYLYTKGSEVLEKSGDIVSVNHKYCLKNINANDASKMTWTVEEKELVVTIPLSVIDKNIRVRKIK